MTEVLGMPNLLMMLFQSKLPHNALGDMAYGDCLYPFVKVINSYNDKFLFFVIIGKGHTISMPYLQYVHGEEVDTDSCRS